jgi:hypothetical protein
MPATSDDDLLPDTPAPRALAHPVVARLCARGSPLFAVLDAARDPLVLARLLGCGERYQSLYEGPRADRLADVAPYLVALPVGTPFLETLVRDGWGKSWGIYLACERPFEELRHHLRRFLTVETEASKKLLFRFYDPRVLRVFLPVCTPGEREEFFGPVTEFLMEGIDEPPLLIFSRDPPADGPA